MWREISAEHFRVAEPRQRSTLTQNIFYTAMIPSGVWHDLVFNTIYMHRKNCARDSIGNSRDCLPAGHARIGRVVADSPTCARRSGGQADPPAGGRVQMVIIF